MVTVDMVCDLIRKKLGSKAAGMSLGADTEFDSVGLSSLQIADVVYTIEDEAGIELDPSDAAEVKTVGQLIKVVEAAESAVADA